MLAVPRDFTKYQFNGQTYGKGQLVLAVVKAYVQKHLPTTNQLREAFPNKLQGSFGVFYTEQEYTARKQESSEQTERFFKNTEDLLTTADGEKIFVCKEWGLDNTTQFIEQAKLLGFDIEIQREVLTRDEIIKQFLPNPAFKKNHTNWSTDILDCFCELMVIANQAGLDIFTVNMDSGGAIRIGRKGHDHKIALEVFSTLEPCQDKINFSQRYKHKQDHLKDELNAELLQQIKASGDLQAFNQEMPVSRAPFWPSDYKEKGNAGVSARIFKVSHSPTKFKKEELAWLEQNQILTVHEDTGNGSANYFRSIEIGDFVSLSYGGQVFKIVKVASDLKHVDGPYFSNDWLMREYGEVKSLEKPKQYTGEGKRWSPSFNGTSWQVPKHEYWMFEQEILQPYYDLTLQDLGFNSSQISKPKPKQEMVDSMEQTPLNQILYGPPGTGKTYHSIEAAVKAAEPEFYSELGIDERYGATAEQRTELTGMYKALFDAGRIKFVTFHQSYGYEEFVEGLSAKTEGDSLSYFEKDGVFKVICDEAKKNLKDSHKTVKELSDENRFDKALEDFKLSMFDEADEYPLTEACSLIVIEKDGFRYGGKWNNTAIMKYDDLKALFLAGVDSRQGIKKAENVSGLAKQHASYFIRALEAIKGFIPQASTNTVVSKKQNFVLIIDEINRGNISKIFGELITLIEPSKRLGQPEALEVILPYSGDKFSIPSNLYLIGTMNTADRSLAMMDTALRRRFDFVEMMPKPHLFDGILVEGISISKLLFIMNRRIEALYDREHTLGHAFFVPVMLAFESGDEQRAFEELKSVFTNKVIPLLEEYFFDDWNKIRLVLGDNQKPEYLQFVTQNEVPYQELFGDDHGLDTYEQSQNTYSLVSHLEQDTVWDKAAAYQAIYTSDNV